MLTPLDADQLDLGSNQVDVRRKQPQSGYGGRLDGLLGRFPTQEHVIDGRMETALLDAQPCRRVALRIEVDQEGRTLR